MKSRWFIWTLHKIWKCLVSFTPPSPWACFMAIQPHFWLEVSCMSPCVTEFLFSGWFEELLMRYVYGSFHGKRLGLFASSSSRSNLSSETIRVSKGQGAGIFFAKNRRPFLSIVPTWEGHSADLRCPGLQVCSLPWEDTVPSGHHVSSLGSLFWVFFSYKPVISVTWCDTQFPVSGHHRTSWRLGIRMKTDHEKVCSALKVALQVAWGPWGLLQGHLVFTSAVDSSGTGDGRSSLVLCCVITPCFCYSLWAVWRQVGAEVNGLINYYQHVPSSKWLSRNIVSHER